MFKGSKKHKKTLIIISLIAYNNKDFLTLTSIYIQHLLRLKSLKKIINNKHDTESLFKVPHFSYLSFPNMSTTLFSSQLCLIKGHCFLKKQYELFFSLHIPQKRWNISFSSENDRFFQLAHRRAESSAMFELYWLPVSPLSELRHHVRLLNQ